MEKSIPNVLAIVGPTASGKSALGVFLAHELGGEIISADSRQVYKGLDIGTGKVTPFEMDHIPHHLLDVVEPTETYTVASYAIDARRVISTVLEHGRLPIICGGTGQYIDVLLDNLSIPSVPPNESLRLELASKTTSELFAMLTQKDPARAATIDPKNPHRLVRALEIVEALGKVPPRIQKSPEFNVVFIGIELDKETLKSKIKKRLDERLSGGMIEEVERLHRERGLSWERLEDLGLEYRYIARYLKGDLTRSEMEKELYRAIVAYAGRQMTWFRRNKRIHWVKTGEEALRIAKNAGL